MPRLLIYFIYWKDMFRYKGKYNSSAKFLLSIRKQIEGLFQQNEDGK